jgi:hypothetical protein
MSIHNYRNRTDLLTEALDRLKELEDKFMYHSNDLVKAKEVVLEATQIYYDAIEYLEANKDYEHYEEFNLDLMTIYAFITSNYFMFTMLETKEKK